MIYVQYMFCSSVEFTNEENGPVILSVLSLSPYLSLSIYERERERFCVCEEFFKELISKRNWFEEQIL